MKPTPCYCGDCSFLKYEDSSGLDYCQISDCQRSCLDKCEFGFYQMKDYQAERILHHLQKWSIGAKCPQPHPFVIGKAIDVAISALRIKQRT